MICLSWLVGYIKCIFLLFFFFLSVTGTAFYYAADGSPGPPGTRRRGCFLGGFHNDVPHFSQNTRVHFYLFFFCAILSIVRDFLFSVVSNERREQRRFYAFLFMLVQFEAKPSFTCVLSNPSSPISH